MAENNKDFIIGGLPLNANDFTDKDKVNTEKMELLSAITKINKMHEQKMSKTTPVQNVGVINNTIDYVKEENETINSMQEDANNFKKDDYILARDIVRHEPEEEFVEEPKYEPDYEDTDEEEYIDEPMEQEEDAPMYVNDEYSGPLDFQEENNDQEFPNMDESGEPMYVIDEEEKNKRNKKKGGKKENKIQKACSPEEIKKGKGVAWMAYIIFFLPLIFNGKNRFVRLHANEGLECNIIDVFALALFFANKFITTTNEIVASVLMGAQIIGIVLIVLTTITKLMSIILSFAGKESHSPWLGRAKIIKY